MLFTFKGPIYILYECKSIWLKKTKKHCTFSYCAPQGTMFGPDFFGTECDSWDQFSPHYNTFSHCFAIHLQIYLTLKTETGSFQLLLHCLGNSNQCMPLNYFKLNKNKTFLAIL